MIDIDRQLDARQGRRMAAEGRMLDRLDVLERRAETLVGELVRGGATVFYINLRNGKTREGSRASLIAFLVRNRYV
jgi:hypothetical protein